MVFVLLGAAVLFAVAVTALGRGGFLDFDPLPAGGWLLPDGDVSAEDIERLRFVIAPRGYRMDQVDSVLDRLQHELSRRDDRIAVLNDRLAKANSVE